MFEYMTMVRSVALQLMRPALIATTLAILTGCGSDTPATGPSGSKVTGTWVLESVDDEEPPVVVHRGPWLDPQTGVFYNNFVFEVTSGYLEIRENETFYLAMQYRVNGDGQTAVGNMEFEGEWDLVNDELVLRVQFPIIGTHVLERDGGVLHTEIDFMGVGDMTHIDFRR